jgi:uracil-DNA glycosylase family 4
MTAEEELAKIAKEVSGCTACGLHTSRKNSVPGEGPADSSLLFIGEGPGFHENEQGRPFVGAAGKFLEELLASIQLMRTQVFICNVVKCRPPGNRDPLPEEIEACRAYLERQIAAIQPQVIVTLGRYSMARYFRSMAGWWWRCSIPPRRCTSRRSSNRSRTTSASCRR